MLSFNEGKKIAELTKEKKRVLDIFINKKKDKPDIDLETDDLIKIVDEMDLILLKKEMNLKPIDIQFIASNLENYKNFNEHFKNIFDRLMLIAKNKLKTELVFIDEQLKPVINMTEFCHYFISGESGSGKTTFAISLVKALDKHKIFYISPKESEDFLDSSLKDIIEKKNFIHVIVNELQDINNIPTMKEMEGSAVIFDDMDTLQNTKQNGFLKDHVLNVRDQMLTRGRHFGLKILILSHNMRNYRETLVPRKECHVHVLFPNHNKFKYDEYLKEFYKFPKKLRSKILLSALDSRWLMIRNFQPSFVMTSNLIRLI